MDGVTKSIWKEKYAEGCEWCGHKIPSMPDRDSCNYKKYGLDFCHIITRRNGPTHAWNGFVLCPTCHRLFDEVIKPKIIKALETAVTGFYEIPTIQKKCVSARNYKEAIELMSHNGKNIADPDPILKRWRKLQTGGR